MSIPAVTDPQTNQKFEDFDAKEPITGSRFVLDPITRADLLAFINSPDPDTSYQQVRKKIAVKKLVGKQRDLLIHKISQKYLAISNEVKDHLVLCLGLFFDNNKTVDSIGEFINLAEMMDRDQPGYKRQVKLKLYEKMAALVSITFPEMVKTSEIMLDNTKKIFAEEFALMHRDYLDKIAHLKEL